MLLNTLYFMSYNTLFHPKKKLYVEFLTRYKFVLKISILFKKLYLYTLTFLKKVNIWTFYIHSIFILICPKLNILKLINKENDGTSVIVEWYIFIVCQSYWSNIYNHIKYILWSIVCPNCCQRQFIIGSESLHMLDLDFWYIYLDKILV